ncbi:TonB-dependent receptor domain-containing protein [Aureivirga sp. CE67]|uniref:TonB-dependent receptor domain-containing protein n=1 Tax=Aureivirga sp. CE67 TaxID=1788983 RepID=UPI0018C9FD89|nr:TonB-dependent receptor [Aureivirga sp. CE67]
MNYKILPLIFALFLSSLLFAQKNNVTIQGKIVEKTSQQPLEIATVTILNYNNETIITGGVTDEKGEFKFRIPSGTYDIKIEYLAFKDVFIDDRKIDKNTTLETILMEEDHQQLDAVEITAEKSTVEYKLDKKVFNVGKDIISKSGSAIDILENVPSVGVDVEGNVSLRGNSGVNILINGKPSVLTSNGGLDQIPSENIAKIEVITNPSAKYESQGTAGIINIILKKNKKSGLAGSVKVEGGIPENSGINFNVNYKTQKFNIFTNLRYRSQTYDPRESFERTNFENGIPVSFQNLDTDLERSRSNYNIYFGGDYYFNDKNTLSLTYTRNHNENERNNTFLFSSLDQNKEIIDTYRRIEKYEEPQTYNQLEIDYLKTFDKKGKKLRMNLEYDFWNDDENESITAQIIEPLNPEVDYISSRDIESSKDLYFQTDFETPIGEKGGIETGVRGQYRRIRSNYNVMDNGELVDQFTNLFKYNEGIYGAYVQYKNSKNKFKYMLGLRTEITNIEILDHKNIFDQTKNYINLFPTVHLTYNFSEKSNIQLSYSKRISRPRFWQLNPFGGIANNQAIYGGNPDLDPMYTNVFELGQLWRIGKIQVNPSVYFQHTTDFVSFITTELPDGKLFSTPVNLDKEDRIGAEISINYSPVKWLRLSTDFNYYYFNQTGDYQNVSYSSKNDSWSSKINARMRLPKKFSLQISSTFDGKKENAQTTVDALSWTSLGLNKDFLDDKMSFSLSVYNIFDSRIEKRYVTGENFQINYNQTNSGRRIRASLTYRFNRKKNERDRLPD